MTADVVLRLLGSAGSARAEPFLKPEDQQTSARYIVNMNLADFGLTSDEENTARASKEGWREQS